VSWGTVLALSIGCRKGDGPEALPGVPATVLEQARARPVTDPTRARFNVKIRSKLLGVAGSTGGGLVVDRPGRGRIELFGPMGNPLLLASSDGVGLSVVLMGQGKHLVAADAEAVLREATGGVAGLDDLLAVLVGDLPFDTAPVKSMERLGEAKGGEWILVVLEGPKGTSVEATLDPDAATPHTLVARGPKGEELLTASYDRFEMVGDAWMPTRVELVVPAIDLVLESRYKTWEHLDTPPESFEIVVPDGFVTESLEEAALGVVKKATTP
jgi:hypothetical protein